MKRKSLGFFVPVAILSTVQIPVLADEAELREAEKEYRMYQKQFAGQPKHLASQLLYLAGKYQENGEREKAEAAFHEVIRMEKSIPNNEAEVASTTEHWATVLSTPRSVYSFPNGTSDAAQEAYMKEDRRLHKEVDLPRAELYRSEARQLSARVPLTHPQHFSNSVQEIRRYRSEGNKRQADALEAKVLAEIRAAKRGPNPEISLLARTLDQLGDARAGSYEPRGVTEYGGGGGTSAEQLKLEALQVWDMLPASDLSRIAAHRAMIQWYQKRGNTQKVNEQTTVLAQIMGTTDRNKLFPPRRPCYGCGRG